MPDLLAHMSRCEIDLLDKVLRDKRSFITSEQYEEIKKVFYHFDKSKDGLLNQLEFAAAIKAMDFEIADHEQEPTFLRFAKEGQRAEEPAAMTIDLSGFTTFVLQQYKDNDTKDTLFAAFETVANGKDTLSAEDIRAAIPQEEADYLLSQLELKDGDHGLEYKKFTEAIYGGT
uniref:EF-hand domain-containing protein n=1 Tax=Seriola lalandi dorsalis TaxID=1841481 RepID=A0A3B4WT07_SERLL